MTDLGSLRTDQAGNSSALAISDDGAVVGSATLDSGGLGAFVWQSGSGIASLSTLLPQGTPGSIAWAVANARLDHTRCVAGEVTTPANPTSFQHAFSLNPGFRDFNGQGAFTGGQISNALGCNVHGDVVGWANDGAGVRNAFAYFAGTDSFVKLQTPDGVQSTANSINNSGIVVGSSDLNSGKTVGRIWFAPAGNLSITLSGALVTEARAVSSNGLVVGDGGVSVIRAFTYDLSQPHPPVRILPRLSGYRVTRALSVNAQGQIVGESARRTGQMPHAVLWSSGKIYDLNKQIPMNSGWVLETAAGINSLTSIVGTGSHNGFKRAFLLSRL